MAKRVVKMAFLRDTKGAAIFEELGADGKPLESYDGAAVTSTYIRKATFEGEAIPKTLTMTLEW
jgi:hypothetical protein